MAVSDGGGECGGGGGEEPVAVSGGVGACGGGCNGLLGEKRGVGHPPPHTLTAIGPHPHAPPPTPPLTATADRHRTALTANLSSVITSSRNPEANT